MGRTPTWLEELFESRLVPLDRHPFLISALLTSSLMLAATYGGNSFESASEWFEPLLLKVADHWPLFAAVLLGIIAVLLDFIAGWARKVATRLWWHIPCLAGLVILIYVLFVLHAVYPGGQTWFFAPFLYMFILALRFEPRPPAEPVQDSLHREYLVERLVEILQDRSSVPKRIAIMGSWGIGKTVFLRMLRAKLVQSENSTYHMAWVNPWRSQTPEQAWAAIAKSIDYALGNKPSFPRDWVNHPVIVWLLGLIPSGNITPKLVDYFANDVIQIPESNALQIINRTIQSRVGKHGRLIIFVDDMERADPKVVRNLLPVVDRLSQIEQSFFFFAIDPERISEAFEEAEQNAPLTKGYIDKVFDIQIPLDEPNREEILAILLEKAEREDLRFLATSLPSLVSHLPQNPRTAIRFYEVAKTRERMFFGRYHQQEIPEVPFFLCWLIETEFPGFLKSITRPGNAKVFGVVSETPLMDSRDPNTHQEFPVLIRDIAEEIGVELPEKQEEHRLYQHVSALASMSGHSLDWITGDSKPFTLDWIARGHSRLDQLTIPELMRLRGQWGEWAGKKSLQAMLDDEFEDDEFTDPDRCGEQLIDAEINLITSACRSDAGSKNAEESLSGISGQIDRLTSHLQFARENEVQVDLDKLNKDVFYRWLKFIVEVPIDGNKGEVLERIGQSRIRFHEELARSLPFEDALRAVWWGIRNEVGLDLPELGERRKALEDYLSSLTLILRRNGSGELLAMFRDGRIAAVVGDKVERRWPPTALPNQRMDMFLSPETWLPLKDGEWQELLEKLVEEAACNQNIAAACADIIGINVVHPAACDVCMGGHAKEREFIQRTTASYPGYLKYLWDAAMKLDHGVRDYDRLIQERKRAESSGHFDAEFLSGNFPLPSDDD